MDTPSQRHSKITADDLLNSTLISDCALLDLPVFRDERGSLCFMEGNNHVPFSIARVFYLFDVPAGSVRAAHALRSCAQVIVALGGSFSVILNDGNAERRVELSNPSQGLLIPPKIWREVDEFSPGSTCLVLASEPYDPAAYYEKYDEYLAAVGRTR